MSPKCSRPKPAKPSSAPPLSPPVARAGGCVLHSATVGGLPMVNQLLGRMRLEEFLRDALPREDGRTKLSPTKTLLVLLRNLLLSREPIYGVGEWAARYAPDLLGLNEKEVKLLNDDRVGRALDKLFAADVASLVLRVATHVVKEFGLRLDELHNDSTSVSFFGAYLDAAREGRVLGRPTLAITFGHSKDHRPDLKQLLFILTVTADGGVPLHFPAASGNVTDDTTHRDTWDLLCQLTGRRDFLYVADSKLATRENMAYLHQQQGRFITVLPKTRSEDAAFRALIAQGQVTWRPLWEKTDEEGEVIDRYAISRQPATTAEGYRLVWYHSQRKAEQDAITRAARIQRTLKELASLGDKLRSPRTRYRQESKVTEAAAEILASRLPLAHRPSRTRPLRCRSTSRAHPRQTPQRGSRYRLDPRPTPPPNLARTSPKALWPLTCSDSEIRRKSYRDVRKVGYTSGTFSVSPSISSAWSTSFSNSSSFLSFASGWAPSMSLPTGAGFLPLRCQRSIPARTRFIFA